MLKLLFLASFLLYVQDTHATEEAWDVACIVSPYGCEGVRPPVVLHMKLPEDMAGSYRDGSFTVKISDRIVVGSDYYKIVAAHEFTHYLQIHGHYSGPLSACEREEEAWYVSNVYALKMNRPDLVRYNWSIGYPECQEEE